MYINRSVVKTMTLGLLLTLAAGFVAAEDAAVKPHMMYFYNPSCRLCTKTNVVVAEAEAKYKDVMTHQRFNIADAESGTDNVLYMFDLMDEMEVPEGDNITLVVFLGLLDEENGEVFFTPKRCLIEGEDIIEKLDKEIADFLSKEGKGGETLGMKKPAPFFLSHSPGLHAAG